jgi:hypothetical protein
MLSFKSKLALEESMKRENDLKKLVDQLQAKIQTLEINTSIMSENTLQFAFFESIVGCRQFNQDFPYQN